MRSEPPLVGQEHQGVSKDVYTGKPWAAPIHGKLSLIRPQARPAERRVAGCLNGEAAGRQSGLRRLESCIHRVCRVPQDPVGVAVARARVDREALVFL